MGTRLSALFILCALLVQASSAQYDPRGRYAEWEYDLTLYGWFTSQSGDILLGTRTIRLSPGDYLTDLSWSISAHLEMRKKPWSIIFDVAYHDERRRVIDTLTSFTTSFLGEAAAAYQFTESLEGIAGLRYFNASADLETPAGANATGSEWWIDPIIGGRLRIPFAGAAAATLRGDIGGFGIGSDFSWNLVATVGFRISSLSLIAGYRVWDSAFETGEGSEFFRYDVTSHGPGFGLTFHL